MKLFLSTFIIMILTIFLLYSISCSQHYRESHNNINKVRSFAEIDHIEGSSEPALDGEQLIIKLLTCSCYDINISILSKVNNSNEIQQIIAKNKKCGRIEYTLHSSNKNKFYFTFYQNKKKIVKIERNFNIKDPTEVRYTNDCD